MHTHTTQTKQVGVFPCRGLVAPCQRASGSIKGRPLDVNAAKLKKRSTREGMPATRSFYVAAAEGAEAFVEGFGTVRAEQNEARRFPRRAEQSPERA